MTPHRRRSSDDPPQSVPHGELGGMSRGSSAHVVPLRQRVLPAVVWLSARTWALSGDGGCREGGGVDGAVQVFLVHPEMNAEGVGAGDGVKRDIDQPREEEALLH